MKRITRTCYECEDGTCFFTEKEAYRHEGYKLYEVAITYSGQAITRVCAKNEADAIRKAQEDICPDEIDWDTDEQKVINEWEI